MTKKEKVAEQKNLELELLKNPKTAPIVLAKKLDEQTKSATDAINKNLQALISASNKDSFKDAQTSLLKFLRTFEEARDVLFAKDSKRNHTLQKTLSDIVTALNVISNKEYRPQINVPEQKVSMMPETKEISEAVKMLEYIFLAIQKKSTDARVWIQNTNPENAVPVVLTDSSLKKFYDATFSLFTSGGSATSANQTLELGLLESILTALNTTFTKKTVTCPSSGDNTLHTPASGKKIRLYFFGYSAGAGTSGVLVGLKFAGGGTVFDQQYLVAAGQPYARNIQAGKRYIDGGGR